MSEKIKKGDTMIEVMLAISIFSIVSIISMSLMNHGLRRAQTALEITMVRNEIDAQAEALRFIHNSFVADRDLEIGAQEYSKLWENLEANGGDPALPLNYEDCQTAMEQARSKANVFVVNTRILSTTSQRKKIDDLKNRIIFLKNQPESFFSVAPLYPRLIYSQSELPTPGDKNNSDQKIIENNSNSDTADMPVPFDKITKVEGLWVQGVPQDAGSSEPQFFDFHIRACWHSNGNATPSTIGTVLRLYNPRYAEKGKDAK